MATICPHVTYADKYNLYCCTTHLCAGHGRSVEPSIFAFDEKPSFVRLIDFNCDNPHYAIPCAHAISASGPSLQSATQPTAFQLMRTKSLVCDGYHIVYYTNEIFTLLILITSQSHLFRVMHGESLCSPRCTPADHRNQFHLVAAPTLDPHRGTCNRTACASTCWSYF